MSTFQASYQAPQMKASDADRDAVVSALSENYQAGRLTSEELEERTGRALSARTFGELQSLTADLPGPVQPDPQPGPVPAMPGETARYGRSVRRLPLVIAVLVVIAVARVGLSLGTGHSGVWLLIPIALVALRLGMLRRGGRRGGGFRSGNGGLFGGNEDSRGTRRF
jgi:hypothetical protein